MAIAIEQGAKSLSEGGVPVGAALVADGQLLAAGHNRRVQQGSADPPRRDRRAGERRPPARVGLRRATMYTTLSPCDMCTGAILLYDIPRVVIGENETFEANEAYLRSRGVEVVVLESAACKALMDEFIARYPEIWNEDIGE